MKNIIVPILLAVIVAYLTVQLVNPATEPDKSETAFDRVVRTGTIRCGYFLFPPLAMKDPNTNDLTGITVDIFNRLGKNLNLKVEWTEEVDFAGLIPGLQTGRYDAICTPMWPTAARAREVEFITPQFFAALGVWVRADDDRFTNNIPALNDESITISGIDGQIEQTIHDDQFPKAKMVSLPGGTNFSESLLNVAAKKADVTFVDRAAGALFAEKHPGKLKDIADSPLRVFPFSIAVMGGETRLKNMMDIAIDELHNTGYIQRKLDEYDPDRYFLPVNDFYKSGE